MGLAVDYDLTASSRPAVAAAPSLDSILSDQLPCTIYMSQKNDSYSIVLFSGTYFHLSAVLLLDVCPRCWMHAIIQTTIHYYGSCAQPLSRARGNGRLKPQLGRCYLVRQKTCVRNQYLGSLPSKSSRCLWLEL